MPKERSEILEFLAGYSNFDKIQPRNCKQQELNYLNGKSSHAMIKLLKDEECTYLRNYGVEIFNDMIAHERKSQFSSLLTRQRQISRQLRASVIDWLFEVLMIVELDDRTVIYQAINLMDQYYEQCGDNKSDKDL